MVAGRRTTGNSTRQDDIARLVGVFHDIFRSSLHQLRPILQEHGVTMSQFLTLHVVLNLKVASVGDVARRLGVSAPAVSVSVDPLEAAGLVCRRRSTQDARTVALVATPAGGRSRRESGPGRLR